MSDVEFNPSFIGGDRSFVLAHLKRLLERRRSLVPWPLTKQETPLLWWPDKSYDLLHELKLLGNYDKAFEYDYSISLEIPPSGATGFSQLSVMSMEGVPVFNNRNSGSLKGSFNFTATGVVASKFNDWFQKARVIHSWNLIAEDVLSDMTSETRSWGQLRKAFPEMYDSLADIQMPNDAWKYSNSALRVTSLLKLFRDRGHAGAHDTLSNELKQKIRLRKAPLIAVLKQALSISSSVESYLDDGIFKKTWFE